MEQDRHISLNVIIRGNISSREYGFKEAQNTRGNNSGQGMEEKAKEDVLMKLTVWMWI